MEGVSFTELFPEWVLSSALQKACKDTTELWDRPIIHPAVAPENLKKFSDIFPSSLFTPLVLHFERPFQKNEAKYYSIPPHDFEKYFWSLRPDFIILEEKQSLILLLEAKGGEVPDKAWKHPKEISYYRFLVKCNWSQKGFYYIIPKKFSEGFKKCLTDAEYFEPSDVHTGLIYWEDLLPIIDDEVTGTALDQVIKEMKGLEQLRKWKKNRT
jgi:hypothetical protein